MGSACGGGYIVLRPSWWVYALKGERWPFPTYIRRLTSSWTYYMTNSMRLESYSLNSLSSKWLPLQNLLTPHLFCLFEDNISGCHICIALYLTCGISRWWCKSVQWYWRSSEAVSRILTCRYVIVTNTMGLNCASDINFHLQSFPTSFDDLKGAILGGVIVENIYG